MCPEYLIHLHEICALDQTVALVGSTTGSHTGQPPQEELQCLLIWLAVVQGEKVAEWRLLDNSPENRCHLGISGKESPIASLEHPCYLPHKRYAGLPSRPALLSLDTVTARSGSLLPKRQGAKCPPNLN